MNTNSLDFDFNSYVNQPVHHIKNTNTFDLSESLESAIYNSDNSQLSITQERNIENKLRGVFNRFSLSSSTIIGKHPDFNDLAGTENTRKQYICSLFIDIKDSTRLGLKYDLEFVKKFKNAVIRMCIEVVKSFDGYIHRIMGDAVLVFFGSSKISKEQAILDSITAISMLDFYLVNYVKPWLKEQKRDFDEKLDFGFRMGCNFGDDKEVLWSDYGYYGTGEVSPTGFPIDIASKLQSLANKNTCMLGQGLLDMMNFPKDFCYYKQATDQTDILYVTPNYTLPNGGRINYKMQIFKIKEYLKGIYINTEIKEKFHFGDSVYSPKFDMKVEFLQDNNISNFTSNTVIPKNAKIRVTISGTDKISQGEKFKVHFEKINHKGHNNESFFQKEFHIPGMLKEFLADEINPDQGKNNAEFIRNCNFRGIHRVKCIIKDENKKIVFKDYINVPIV